MKIILFIVLILFVYCQEFEINETFETVEENEYQFFTRLANKSDVTTMIEEKKSFVLCLFAKFSEKSLEFSKRYDLVANSLKDCVEYEFFRFEYQKEDNDLIKNMEFPNINAILTIKNGQPNEVFSGEAEVFKISIKSKFLGPITFIKSVRGFEAIESQAEKLIKTIVINSKKKEEDKTSISSIKTAIESKELTDTDQKKKFIFINKNNINNHDLIKNIQEYFVDYLYLCDLETIRNLDIGYCNNFDYILFMLTKNGKRGNDENGKGNKHKKETEVRENEEREGIDGDGELLISKHYLPSPDTDDGENIYHNNLESFFQEIKQYYQKEIFKFEQTFYESIRKQNYFNILLYKVEYKLHSPEINTIGELRKANITPPTIILTANKDDSPFSNEIPNTRGIYIHTKHKTSKKYQVVSYTIEDFPSEDQFDRRLNIYYYLIPIIIGFLTTFIVSIWAYK